jgi:membrane-associated phospholipid phosphatase
MTASVNRRLIAAAGCAVALAAVIVAAYSVGPLARADGTALHGLKSLSLHHQWIWTLGDGLSHSVDLPYLVAALLLICVAGIAWGRPRQVAAAVVLVVGANFLTQLIKIVAAHPRYQSFLGPHQLDDSAFPSGHATAAMSLALAAVLVTPRRWRRVVAVGGGSFALAVSTALVIQGWHFPSDILGAFLVNGMVSMLVLAGLAAIGARSAAGRSDAPRRRPALAAISASTLQLLAVAVAAGAAAVLLTHPSAVTSYAAAHTTSVAAAIGIALASFGIVSGVTAELETRS